MKKRFALFFILNFTALGLGGILMGSGPASEWYKNLNQAPWTPPGWAFGAAWTTIMIAFSIYMAVALKQERKNKTWGLYFIQWILNVGWNPVFFKYHYTLAALFMIIFLTMLIASITIKFFSDLNWISIFILPYLIWLIIACSLNAYIVFHNP